MPKNNELINVDLENFLDAKGMDAVPYDSSGKQVPIPDEAELFQFKFAPNGEEKGTATVSIDGTKSLNLYYDDAIMNEDNGADEWFQFVKQLKRFAMMHQLDFKTKNIDRLATDMKKREHQKKLDEGYYGTRHTSYSDKNPGTVKMILKHNRPLEETDARFRNIEKIFLETETGERFLLDTKKPSIARAYARHLAEGGRYNDERWNHIGQIAEDINRLGGFVRATRNKQFNEGAVKLVNEAQNHYQSLRETIKHLQSSRGYNKYFESWKPTLNEESEDNSISEMFLTQRLDPRVESAIPVLNRLAKNITEMSELNEFENWANDIVKEVLHPTSAGSLEDLVDLLGADSEYLTLGPDGKNAINEIEGIIDEPALNSRLQKAGMSKPDQDARPIIIGWMQENAKDKHYEEILSKIETEQEPTPAAKPAPKPAPKSAAPAADKMPPPPNVDEDYDPRLSQKTQIAGTLPTYRYAKGLLDKVEGPQGKTLDFGAGLGLGTAELGPDAHSYEMHPKAGFKPNFDRVDSIPDESYAKIVSLNVLNVIPNDKGWRDAAVKDIGRILMQGGSALITTRGKDVLSAKGTPQDEPNSIITTAGTFQKGFTPQELKGYVQSVLGGGFTVKTVKVGSAPAAILVTKGGEQVNELKGKMPTPDEMKALLQKQKERFKQQGFVRAADDTEKMLKQRAKQTISQPSAKVEEYLKEFEYSLGEDLDEATRRDILRGLGVAGLTTSGIARGGEYKSAEELAKNPDEIIKIWNPRIQELEKRCYNILKSFISVSLRSDPEWAEVLKNIKIKITLGDSRFKGSHADYGARPGTRGVPIGVPYGQIILDCSVFYDAPDNVLAWILGHEAGHIIALHDHGGDMAKSRRNEHEADAIGAILAKKIGYDKANFFEWAFKARIENLRNSTNNSSHPEPIDRARILKPLGFELSKNAADYIKDMTYKLDSGLAENLEEAKDKESSVKVRNPVAKNAMAGIGGGGMGKHKDKKQADKRGEVKHKKDKVPMDLEEGSLDRIRKLSGL